MVVSSYVRMRDAYRKSCLFPVHMAEVQVGFFSSLFAVKPYGFLIMCVLLINHILCERL